MIVPRPSQRAHQALDRRLPSAPARARVADESFLVAFDRVARRVARRRRRSRRPSRRRRRASTPARRSPRAVARRAPASSRRAARARGCRRRVRTRDGRRATRAHMAFARAHDACDVDRPNVRNKYRCVKTASRAPFAARATATRTSVRVFAARSRDASGPLETAVAPRRRPLSNDARARP